MAIIAPNTDVYLLRNVPLNNDYENTFYFNSATEQYNYFYPKRAYTKVNYTFQRNNGMLRVDVPAESAMQCNYLMYRNRNYGNKWFYAFINNVHYINNETSEIEFELDVIQTWLFDFMNVTDNIGTIDNCFIERQHATRDRIGDNIIPEPVENGDYVYNGNFTEFPVLQTSNITDKDRRFVLIIGYAEANNTQHGVYFSRVNYGFSGLKLWATYPDNTNAIDTFLSSFLNRGDPDAVKFIQFVPFAPFSRYINTTQHSVSELSTTGIYISYTIGDPVPITLSVPKLQGNERLDGYLPYNKKLYTYPYNALIIGDGTGNNQTYCYEYFSNLGANVNFDWFCNIIPPIESYIMPKDYKNISTDNTSDKFVIGNYAQGSWTNDAYQAWLAQNSFALGKGIIGTVGNILGGVIGGIANNTHLGRILWAQRRDAGHNLRRYNWASSVPTSNTMRNIDLNRINTAVDATTTGINGIMDLLNQTHQAKIQADILSGQTDSNGLQDLGYKTIVYNRISLRYQYAQRIDQFFNLYGYAQNIVDRPVLNARTRYTYIKTLGCDIHPNVPAEYVKNICRLFDKGIRFWVDKTYFQDYALDNDPIFQ